MTSGSWYEIIRSMIYKRTWGPSRRLFTRASCPLMAGLTMRAHAPLSPQLSTCKQGQILRGQRSVASDCNIYPHAKRATASTAPAGLQKALLACADKKRSAGFHPRVQNNFPALRYMKTLSNVRRQNDGGQEIWPTCRLRKVQRHLEGVPRQSYHELQRIEDEVLEESHSRGFNILMGDRQLPLPISIHTFGPMADC